LDFIKKYYFKELILKSFEDFGLLPELLEAIKEMGFEKPTPIQEKTIPFLLENDSDFIGLAQTGTGKTAAFGLPIIQKLDLNAKRPQAIIICPTRELCLQIENDLKKFSKILLKGVNANRGVRVIMEKNTVLYIARLSRLELNNEEQDEITNDFMKIIGFVEKISELDVKDEVSYKNKIYSKNIIKFIGG
jgi:superfamily II DNA/RNA helicase